MNPFIITRYGHKIHFLKPQISEIDIRDIAHSLSRIPRFNGHTIKPYYVAQHVCLCADAAPEECKREAFAHDFQEYACADVPAPLKSLLPQYAIIEARLEKVISRRFHYRYPYPPGVREIDMRLLVTEMKCLTRRIDWKQYPFSPLNLIIEPWGEERCHREFMKRFRRLFR
jgi:hypothetical protein